MARVSVILNSYNQRAYLRDAIESVCDQTYHDWELILIDNGSDDGSHEICRQFESDQRVLLRLHRANASITSRFNEGVAAASGEFVCFLYSDDYYLDHKLLTQVDAFDSLDSRYGVVYGPGRGLNQLTGATWDLPCLSISNPPLRSLLRHWQDGQPDMISPMFRKSCLTLHPFHEDIFAEGEAILFRVGLTHWFWRLDSPVAVIRDTGQNAGKALRRNRDITFTTLERLEGHAQFPDSLRGELDEFRRRLSRSYGWQAVRLGGDLVWGRTQLLSSASGKRLAYCHPKLLVGLVLSVFPAPIRALLNKFGTRIRRAPGNSALIDDFPGDVF